MEGFWENRWQNNNTGWDIKGVSPPLAGYIDQILPENRDHLHILIPGCGNGYEAIYLLEKGFRFITMLDIAPTAVERLRQRLDVKVPNWDTRLQLVCGDFFTHSGAYDLILEQTFFCALDPSLREQYTLKMKQLLKPGGKLAGVLFDRAFSGGPPFGGDRKAYRSLFEPHFRIRTLAHCYNSIAPRAGTEVFFILEK